MSKTRGGLVAMAMSASVLKVVVLVEKVEDGVGSVTFGRKDGSVAMAVLE